MVGGASLCAHPSSYGQAEIVEFMLLVNNSITIVLTHMEMRESGSDLLSQKLFCIVLDCGGACGLVEARQ